MTAEYSILGGILLLISILLGLRQLTAPWRKRVKQTKVWLDKFMRDWSGEDEEDGRAAVPGVMERLNKLDGELSNNGGSSLKDKVEKTQKAVEEMSLSVEEVSKSMDSMSRRMETIERILRNTLAHMPRDKEK